MQYLCGSAIKRHLAKIAKNAINAGKTAAAENERGRGGDETGGECGVACVAGENEKLVDF